MRRVEDTAIAFARACDAVHVPYALIGGFAVIAWGQPRTTQDVDVLLILDEHVIERLCDELARHGLEVGLADLRDAAREKGHVTIFDPGSRFHVDARPIRTETEAEQVRSAIGIDFKGQRIQVARPEETIAFKLSYGSEQDLQDARSILIRQDTRLDMARLRELVARLGVERALDDLLRL